jgi:hypothetical protein
MAEIYNLVQEYRSDVVHDRSGTVIKYIARLLEGPSRGRLFLEHSHVVRPTEGAGFWYSDSHTSPRSPDEAKALVAGWANQIETAFEVKEW